MFEKARLLNLLVCAVFGLVGGMVSHLLFTTKAVSAQQTSDVIQAKRFEVIDGRGITRATFGIDSTHASAPPSLILRDGQALAELDGDSLTLTDDSGKKRVVLGVGAYRHSGGAMFRTYLLDIADNKGVTKHLLKP